VLAIRYPAKSILSLERSLKKQTFLAETVKALDLKNVRLGETFLPREKVRAFVISRAVLAPADFFENVGPFLAHTSRVAVTGGRPVRVPKSSTGFSSLGKCVVHASW
jgi:16S rRNA G527 N7-methylase RsmG